MKYRLYVVAIFCLITVSSGESNDSRNWGGNFGGAFWQPGWTADHNEFDSSSTGLFGPSLFFHYNNAGIGIQYFSGDFNLNFTDSTQPITAARTDMDIFFSYRLGNFLQLSAIYKNIKYDWDQKFSVKSHITGFGLGAGFNHILPERFLLYGYGFYLPELDYSQEISWGNDLEGSARGYWLEAGVGYLPTSFPIIIRAGYRHQHLSIDVTHRSWIEKTSGLRFDISYYF